MLLIQSWLVPGAEIRETLRAAGYQPHLYRVDFEPALVAALQRGGFHIVVLDSQSTGLTRPAVLALMAEHNVALPLVDLVPGRSLCDDVRIALSALRN